MYKKYGKFIITPLLICIIIGVFYYTYNEFSALKQQYSNAQINLKAYIEENKQLKADTIKQSRVFKLTIDQFSQYSDSILEKLNKYRNDLRIKDENLQSLQYIQSHTKKDTTFIFKDSILVKGVNIDTTISDKWASLNLILKYPDTIKTSQSFNNEIKVAISLKKETIEPPKKFFIARWFQKKQLVTIADVKDENPYTKLQQQKFVQIVKIK